MGFSRQEYWSGFWCPPPADLLDPGIKPSLLHLLQCRQILFTSFHRSPIRTNSDDHYIYYSGQEPLQRNGVVLIVNKRVWNAVLWCNLKNDRMVSAHFQGKPFNFTVIQVYAPVTNAKEAEVEWFYEDLLDLLVCVLVTQSFPALWDPLTVACQAPLSMEFSKQEYWSGLPFPTSGDLLELMPKRCPFHHRRWECKNKKSWDTWSNSQL